MAYTDLSSELDYPKGLAKELGSKPHDILHEFFELHREDFNHRQVEEEVYDSDEFGMILAAKVPEQSRMLLDQHAQMNEERIIVDHAVSFLARTYEFDPEALEVERLFDVLLFMWKHDITGDLDRLIVSARVQSASATNIYTLDQSFTINSNEVRAGLEEFHSAWNQEQENPKATLTKIESVSEDRRSITFQIFREKRSRSAPTFAFRKQGRDGSVPQKPELTEIDYTPLRTNRVHLVPDEKQTTVIIPRGLSGWKRTLDSFFEHAFGVSEFTNELEVRESEFALELESEVASAVMEDDVSDPFEYIQDFVNERAESAMEDVDDLDLPEEQREELKDTIDTVGIAGSGISDDPSIAVDEFRLVSELDTFFDEVNFEEAFQDIIKTADENKRNFVFTVNNRPVSISGGSYTKLKPGLLRQREQRALEIFFGGREIL